MTNSSSSSTEAAVVLLGDSDMAKWPSDLLPSLTDYETLDHHIIQQTNYNYSKNGAFLSNVNSQLSKVIIDLQKSGEGNFTFFVICAGENDISSGHPVDTILHSFKTLIHDIFQSAKGMKRPPHVIFFGPKIEPWLDEDLSSRKLYYQLSERLFQTSLELNTSITECCNNIMDSESQSGLDYKCGVQSNGENITYVDCLTMFCGDEHGLRSGILNGSTKADKRYFEKDGLHLSHKGYEIWKEELELILGQLICNERCDESLDKSNSKKIDLDL